VTFPEHPFLSAHPSLSRPPSDLTDDGQIAATPRRLFGCPALARLLCSHSTTNETCDNPKMGLEMEQKSLYGKRVPFPKDMTRNGRWPVTVNILRSQGPSEFRGSWGLREESRWTPSGPLWTCSFLVIQMVQKEPFAVDVWIPRCRTIPRRGRRGKAVGWTTDGPVAPIVAFDSLIRMDRGVLLKAWAACLVS
jgi:hypothetical protein